jgi:hypothetical protein
MNVEIDPVSELAVADKIESKKLRIVGWYHSHPLFQPDPSVRDIQTQRNYQALFRDARNDCEPFIGAIAGAQDRLFISPLPYSNLAPFLLLTLVRVRARRICSNVRCKTAHRRNSIQLVLDSEQAGQPLHAPQQA